MSRPRDTLVLQHSQETPPGYLEEVGFAIGDIETVALHGGEPVPSYEGWRAIVSLGGLMYASEAEAHPWMLQEQELLHAATRVGVPVLGIGLGCQLLAAALGGRVYRGEDGPELGVVRVEVTEAGRGTCRYHNTVWRLGEAAPPVWHRDTFELPPGARLLARTDCYPHAFELGSALGIQAHPEASPEIVEGWIASERGAALIEEAGTTAEQVREQLDHLIPTREARVFVGWASDL